MAIQGARALVVQAALVQRSVVPAAHFTAVAADLDIEAAGPDLRFGRIVASEKTGTEFVLVNTV